MKEMNWSTLALALSRSLPEDWDKTEAIELPKTLYKKHPRPRPWKQRLREKIRAWLYIDQDLQAMNRDILALMEKQMRTEAQVREHEDRKTVQ
jgi:Skp family chaperone for outer membrane proteins